MSLSLYNYMVWSGNAAYSSVETADYLYIAGDLQTLLLRDDYIAQQHSSDFPVANVIRISKATGLLDEAFNTAMLQIPEIDGSSYLTIIKKIAISSTNKLYCVTYNYNDGIIKIDLNTNTRDQSFVFNFDNGTHNIVLDSNENVYVSGHFYGCNGITTGSLLKINSNGTIDAGFSNNTQILLNSQSLSSLYLNNNSLYLGGQSHFGEYLQNLSYGLGYNATSFAGIVKINPATGERDQTFNVPFPSPEYSPVSDMVFDNNTNKMYIVGLGLIDVNNMVRIDQSTGAIDSSFVCNASSMGKYKITADLNNNAIYAFAFNTSWDPVIRKINADTGNLDSSFDLLLDGNIYELKIDSFGNLIVLGNFWSHGTSSSGVVYDSTVETSYWGIFSPTGQLVLPSTNNDPITQIVVIGDKVVGAITVDPTVTPILVNNQPLPVNSVLKNASTGQKYIKVEGDATAFVAIEVIPPTEWGWSQEGLDAWAILQNL